MNIQKYFIGKIIKKSRDISHDFFVAKLHSILQFIVRTQYIYNFVHIEFFHIVSCGT